MALADEDVAFHSNIPAPLDIMVAVVYSIFGEEKSQKLVTHNNIIIQLLKVLCLQYEMANVNNRKNTGTMRFSSDCVYYKIN